MEPINWSATRPAIPLSDDNACSFPSNIASYFRRPNKVSKTSNRHLSPRSQGQRRMTSHLPARPRSMVDRRQHNGGPARWSADYDSASRPISWHPVSMDAFGQMHAYGQHLSQTSHSTPFTSAQDVGLVTPTSYPLSNEPQIQELIEPLQDLSANDPDRQVDVTHELDYNPYWLDDRSFQSPKYLHQHVCDDGHPPPAWSSHEYYDPSVPAQIPPFTGFLPMPDMGGSLELFDTPQGSSERDDLVGMGLYDTPADVQSASLSLLGDVSGIGRKSLILEESFEPTSESDSNDDQEDDDDDDDDDDDGDYDGDYDGNYNGGYDGDYDGDYYNADVEGITIAGARHDRPDGFDVSSTNTQITDFPDAAHSHWSFNNHYSHTQLPWQMQAQAAEQRAWI